MSLGPVGNNSQQTRVAELAKKEPAAKVDAQATTTTPDDVEAKSPVSQDAQDAARQMQDAAGRAIQQKLEGTPADWLEAAARRRGGRGGKTVAQGPTRGLGGSNDDVA